MKVIFMIHILATIFIFLIVLMIYLHIQYHLKVNNTLEHYRVEEFKRDNINKICQLKQPFSFLYQNKGLLNELSFDNLKNKLKDEYIQIRKKTDDLFLPMKLEKGIELFEKDSSNNYYSENNELFLKNTDIIKHYNNDPILKPCLKSNHKYDVIMGTKGVASKLKYNLYYRNFFYVTDGKCKIRLLTPDNYDDLDVNKNYDLFEYNSSVDCFSDEFQKKYIDVELSKGEILFIPSYWFYSVQFMENSIISCFHFGTYLSNISIIPEVCKHLLQKQNIVLKMK